MPAQEPDFEFYCQVFDENIPHLRRNFFASVEFKSDHLLVMCLDGSVRLPDTCIYVKDSRVNGPLHQIGYRSIRYIKRLGREVTIVSDRKKVQLLLANGSQASFDLLLNAVYGDEQVFQEVDTTQLIEHMGVRAHRRYVALLESTNQSSNGKFWLTTLYPPLVSLLSSINDPFELWLASDRVHQKKLNLIVAAMHQEMRNAQRTIEDFVGYGEEQCADVFELIEEYKRQMMKRW